MKKLFPKFVSRYSIKPGQLKTFRGKRISFNAGGQTDVIALATEVKNSEISYKVITHPFSKTTNHPSDQGLIRPVYCEGRSLYDFNRGRFKVSAYKMHVTSPRTLAFDLHAQEFMISSEDKELSRLLKKLKDEIGEIRTGHDLKKIAESLKQKVRFLKKRDDSLDARLSLGDVVKSEGAVCRHLAGISHAYLTAEDIESDLLGSGIIDGESHSFLKVRLKGKEYLFDPTMEFVMDYSTSRSNLKNMRTARYHFPNRKFKIRFVYE